MIRGGIADKLGNRYEAKWLALKLIDVVRGDASSLRFEGTAEAFAGFEFLLTKGAEKQWHQVKISNTSGNWTENRLRKLGVLESFRKRLCLEDESDQCHFVSQDPAVNLRDLTERARTANDYSDFEHLLTKELSESLKEIIDAWSVKNEVAYAWLRRVHCRTQPEDGLDEYIEAFGGLCFSHDPAMVFGSLRDYMEQRFNRHLTTDVVRIELPQSGIALAHWQLDPTLTERLRSATGDYLISYAPVASENLIPRKEAQLLIEELTNPEGASVVLLTGSAGSGKSGVVHQFVAELGSRGVTHVVLRADDFLGVETQEDIGRRLTARGESPVVTLKGVSGAALSVLVIDQVDAVSEVSGRETRLKPLLLRMLSDAEKFDTVKVVCVCRAFDLENDARLKALAAQNSVRRIEIAPLDWNSEVQPLLQRRGIDVGGLSSGQQRLLELPLNLGIYLEVHDDGRGFNNRNDLFTRLLAKKTRVIARERAPAWSLAQPLDTLVKWMSDHQTLQAPLSSLRRFDSALDILASENLITVRAGRVHLFHESFFDYLFAHNFITSSQTVVGLLLSDDDQYLFRRTQVRQILESLKEDDRRRYLTELEDVLTNTAIRYHIKIAVTQWLGALKEPGPDELKIVMKLDTSPARFSPLVRLALYGTAAWFDVAQAADGLIERELNSALELRREDTLWWLSRIATQRTDEVSKLLGQWYGSVGSITKAERLVDWFAMLRGQPIKGRLLSLYTKVIKEHPRILLGKGNRYRISSLFDSLPLEGTTEIVPLVEMYFDSWFVAHPEGHPFLRGEDEFDIEPLLQLAKQRPRDFLTATTRALSTTIARIAKSKGGGEGDWTFQTRRVGEQYSASDKFLTAYREALKSTAESESQLAEQALSQLTPSEHPSLLHLHLEAIAANGTALAYRLTELLAEPELFNAGWSDAPYQSFADAARAALPFLKTEQRREIENAVSGYRPEIEFVLRTLSEIQQHGENNLYRSRAIALSALNHSGHAEWSVWESVGDELLSEEARYRLAELRRKFPGQTVRVPQGIRVGFVGSPISQTAVSRLSERDWLKAIAEYAEKGRRPQRTLLRGGAEQIAGQLLQLTKQNPSRFASLLTKIPDSAPHSYVRNILLGLGEAEAPGLDALISQAIVAAHQRSGHPFGSEIAHAISKHPGVAGDDVVFDALCWYVKFGTQEQSTSDRSKQNAETISIEQLLSRGDSVYTQALSGQRGSALDALARVLWRFDSRNEQAWELLKDRVFEERELSARCVLAHMLLPLFNADKARCAELFEQLSTVTETDGSFGGLQVLTSRVGNHLLLYILRQMPDVGERLVERLLASEDDVLRGIGAWQIISASFYDDKYIPRADRLVAESGEFKFLAVECAADAVVDGELTDRALETVSLCFNDPDKQIRAKASDVFRSIPSANFERATSLCRRYIDSLAFDEHSFQFFDALGKATCDVVELVVRAAEKLVGAVATADAPHQRAMDLHQLRELLKKEYASTESSPALRKRILDVLDLMLMHEMYGADEVLKAHERD
ncbi:AAA family ATPase [Paraburkholderia terricola]|uniref:Importin N-terminal domain-containing protein n=1 Tax=Paraburkholderia terricola TaxID=169427 RepID=A0ABU1M058_9BURK|nr:AAA family ATPase [Paraburkholderia terricola]MDR6412387.1 hypothetical protein [Paraburkholderia terricola]MDR6481163.1 hypothetical protein [Paraburkholderia terricola]